MHYYFPSVLIMGYWKDLGSTHFPKSDQMTKYQNLLRRASWVENFSVPLLSVFMYPDRWRGLKYLDWCLGTQITRNDGPPLIRYPSTRRKTDLTPSWILIQISCICLPPSIVGMSHCGIVQTVHDYNLSIADILTSTVVPQLWTKY